MRQRHPATVQAPVEAVVEDLLERRRPFGHEGQRPPERLVEARELEAVRCQVLDRHGAEAYVPAWRLLYERQLRRGSGRLPSRKWRRFTTRGRSISAACRAAASQSTPAS